MITFTVDGTEPLPLMEGEGRSFRVLGFNQNQRAAFVQILMRFSLTFVTNFTVVVRCKPHLPPPGAKTKRKEKKEKHTTHKSYTCKFVELLSMLLQETETSWNGICKSDHFQFANVLLLNDLQVWGW